MERIKDRLGNKKILMLKGEDFDVSTMLSSRKQEVLKSLAAGYDFVFIDEAQTIPDILENLRNGYLLKDVLQLDNLKDSIFVMNLLRIISFQVGHDISFNEIANKLSTTVKTVQRYLDILEKSYIIFRLHGFSRNLRKEITKSPRFYFWDNGIRNVIISNLNPLEVRNDVGQLWKNFCISERIKRDVYQENYSNYYFWRTYDQQEIDLLEESDGILRAFEMKWGSKKSRPPKAFVKNYPGAEYMEVNRESFYQFLKQPSGTDPRQ